MTLIKFLAVLLILSFGAISFALDPDIPQTPQSIDGKIPVFSTIIHGQTPEEVTEEILENDPSAIVMAPEAVAATFNEPTKHANVIKAQNANTLNTLLMGVEFSYETTIYLISPLVTGPSFVTHHEWYQAAALAATNSVYLTQMSLKLGRWSRILQWGGDKIAGGLKKYNIITQDKWETRARLFGNFLTHGALVYANYGLMSLMATLPDVEKGFFSLKGQEGVLTTAGLGFSSGLGWTMLSRKWDELPDSERPISRQAYASFQQVRGTFLGIFVPLIVAATNSDAANHYRYFLYAPLIASAIIGNVSYFWADPILRKYPQIGVALEKFDKVTVRANDRLNVLKDKIKACASRLAF
jgi:hypothetical protein